MPLIDTPFSRVAVDIVGPIDHPTDNSSRIILTVVDYAPRYPEAKALKKIDSETVVEALYKSTVELGYLEKNWQIKENSLHLNESSREAVVY